MFSFRLGGRIAPLAALCFALGSFLALQACEETPAGPVGVDTGRADFGTYVAIGNSLSMGVVDGATVEDGQRCSMPALLARQAGAAGFELPIVSEPGIPAFPPSDVGVAEGGRFRLVSVQPPVIERTETAGVPMNQDLARPFNNLGVSNALLAEALVAEDRSSSLTGNALFDLVHRGMGTYAEQAAELDATFVTLWLGHNDVLIWAGAGGDPSLAPGLPTPVDPFRSTYETLLDDVLAITDQVVLANVTQFLPLPAFQVIPPVVVDPATGTPVTDAAGDPIPLLGPEGPLGADDLVIVTASELLMQGIGVPAALGGTGAPLPNAVVLDAEEQATVRAFVDDYNGVIDEAAAERGLPVVDIAALLDEIVATGVQSDGETFTEDFLVSETFGLDFAHPTCKGYGLVANRFIDVINAAFGASIPRVDVSRLEGIRFPMGASAAKVAALGRVGVPVIR